MANYSIPPDEFDPLREEKFQARRANYAQAKALGFEDLSPSGFYETDHGEHVAVCSHCAALVHYPLPPESFPRKWVKDTDTLRRHLRAVHGIEEESGERVPHQDPA